MSSKQQLGGPPADGNARSRDSGVPQRQGDQAKGLEESRDLKKQALESIKFGFASEEEDEDSVAESPQQVETPMDRVSSWLGKVDEAGSEKRGFDTTSAIASVPSTAISASDDHSMASPPRSDVAPFQSPLPGSHDPRLAASRAASDDSSALVSDDEVTNDEILEMVPSGRLMEYRRKEKERDQALAQQYRSGSVAATKSEKGNAKKSAKEEKGVASTPIDDATKAKRKKTSSVQNEQVTPDEERLSKLETSSIRDQHWGHRLGAREE
jgi:hypothetical protein